MRVGAWELKEPLPRLKEVQALSVLRPWVDVGGVGSLVFSHLETSLVAQDLGSLKRPGVFFDFTRYRPILYFKEGRRELAIPNCVIRYAWREKGPDFLFLHLLEPHMNGELYSSSLVKLMERLEVRRYLLVGAMYDAVPHTRPLRVSGSSPLPSLEKELLRLGVRSSGYQGPTTITMLASLEAAKLGIETASLLVHLPQYAQLEEDYSGCFCLLQLLSSLYDLPLDLEEIRRKGEEQRRQLDLAVMGNPKLGQMLSVLESHYELWEEKREKGEEAPTLSPEIEKFLKDMEKRMQQG